MVEASTVMFMTCIRMCQPKEIINLNNVLRILDARLCAPSSFLKTS